MLKPCPNSIDVTDLQFKLQCKLKIFKNDDVSLFSNPSSLLTCASRYGLLFVGSNFNHFEVIQTQIFPNYTPKEQYIEDYPRRNVEIPSIAKHLCVNCDSTILAVVVEKQQCPIVLFYDVLSFLSENVKIIREVRVSSTPNVYVREINWNPSLPAIFTACKSDGTLGLYELKEDSIDISELPGAAGATCFCWSPKGKQIAVGSVDGKITQYKPDLKAVKAIGEPKLNGPHTLINLQWVSNYQFIGVYQAVQDNASFIIVVDAPKTGEPIYTNYEDICYSGASRPQQFYLILQQNWNFLMIASSNGAEVAVLGNNGEQWMQWIMMDTARAELPLSPDYQETLPVGLTFDISSTAPLPWGESTIPPCPMLCVLSHQGVLCVFNVVYLKEGIPSICTPPDIVGDTTGLKYFVTSSASTDISLPKASQSEPKETYFEMESTQSESVMTPSKNNTCSFPTSTSALNVPSQSTPLVTRKATGDGVSKTLFGGQTTLTPIKPQQPSQILPLIAPVNKDPNATFITSAAGQFNEKYAGIFSSLNPTSAPQSSTVPVKPIVISASPGNPEAIAKRQEFAPTKQSESTLPKRQEIASNLSREIVQKSTAVNKKDILLADEETSAMLAQMVKDEWMCLETEIKVLINMGRSINVSVGTDKDKVDMIEQIESLQEFVKEAVDISIGQSSEIHCLKQNLIQSWAWFEEAKSHYNSSKNEAVALLIQLQPLDSLSEKRLKDIEQLVFYVESQLSQASKTLDEQWDNFQDFAKKTHKVKMPTMETIFQTMVRQNAVLQRQTYILKDISMRLKRKSSNMNSLLLLLDKNRDLADDFQELRLDPQNVLQLQYEKIKSHVTNLSETKAEKLRCLVSQKGVTKITAVKPQVSSWSLSQSPASRMRQSISKLGATSPSVKTAVASKLDFTKSPQLKISEAPQFVQSFSLKTPEKPTFTSSAASVPASSFVPLFKSAPVISSSQGSAFAPIGGADKQQQQQLKASFSFGGAGTLSTGTMYGLKAATGTTAAVTTAFSLADAANAIFTSNVASVKPQTSSTASAFSFGSPSTTSKALLGSSSGIQFSASLSSADQSSKPTSSSFATVSSVQAQSTPQAASDATSKVSTSVAPVSTSLAQKPTSGVASIFANLQSVINKATSPAAVASTPDNSKSSVPLGDAVTTTTQSVFGSLPAATSVAKPLFGSFTTSDAGSMFGNITKSAADSSSQNLFGSGSNSVSTSFFGKVGESVTKPAETTVQSSIVPSSSSNVITVSLFEPKSSTSEAVKTSSAPATMASATNSFFGSSTAPSGTNIFNSSTVSVAPSIFAVPKTTTPAVASAAATTTAAKSSGSIFSSPTSTTTANIFSASKIETTSAVSTGSSGDSIFGGGLASVAPVCSVGAFSTPVTSPIFGGSSLMASGSVFGIATTVVAFSTATTTTTTASSAIGSPATPTNIFGTATSSSAFDTSSTKTSIFGSPPSASIFGAAPSSSTGNIFAPATATSNTTPFGSPATANIFGAPAVSTTASSVFGNSTKSTTTPFGSQSGSIFGAPNSGTNIFGQPAAFGSQPAFGAAPTTTASTIFGQPAAFGAGGQPAVFGSTPTAPTTSGGSVFGAPVASNAAFGSGFGTAPTTNTFGAPAQTQPATASFGFGSLNVGDASSSGSIFGGSSGSVFGQTATATANPFGKVETKPAFGSASSSIFGNAAPTTANIFGSPATTASSIFGSGGGTTFGGSTSTAGGFGSQSTFGSSTFGQKPAFGQAPAFGSTSFGSSQPGGFSGGGTSPVAQSGFGSPASFQKPSGFGSPPVFGGSPTPAFGAAPSFGGTASFGGTSTFGSPEKVFGASQPAPGAFGSATQQSAGFGNLATQNTIGFGNLAQQASTPTTLQFSGSSSFSSWR